MTKRNAKPCPICGWKTLPIIYGLPSPDAFKRTDIVLGGCIIQEMAPNLSCSNCDWEGNDWALMAPLIQRAWIMRPSNSWSTAVGLVAERFDQIVERFLLGCWAVHSSKEEFSQWLNESDDIEVWCAWASDLAPNHLAALRVGEEMPDDRELGIMGFWRADHGVPKFRFEKPAWPAIN